MPWIAWVGSLNLKPGNLLKLSGKLYGGMIADNLFKSKINRNKSNIRSECKRPQKVQSKVCLGRARRGFKVLMALVSLSPGFSLTGVQHSGNRATALAQSGVEVATDNTIRSQSAYPKADTLGVRNGPASILPPSRQARLPETGCWQSPVRATSGSRLLSTVFPLFI
jgi:hypothetical protein